MPGRRTLRIVAALSWTLSAIATEVHAGGAQRTRLAVGVQNLPGVTSDVLAEARHHVLRVYAAAGIDVLWFDNPEPARGGDLSVTLIITTTPPTVHGATAEILGVAISAKTQCGRVAYALWHHITAFAEARNRPLGVILGYVIAHEIGHLLMPPPSHGDSGLMRAAWRPADLDKAERGLLRFTPAEADVMRRRIAAEATLMAMR
jgi:hypothetical protein